MTLEQKVHMLHGRLLTKKETAAVGYIPAIPELGVPEFVQSDGPLGVRNWEDKATAFPSPIGYAASWSPAIAALEGRIAGEDALALGTDAIYGPGLNMARNPEAGRTFEYFGEDPFLTGSMTAANVKGMQSTGVIATLKHYVANNQETSRHLGESRVPSRALREIYMKPYEIAIKEARPGSVMCSYNAINGEHGCGSYFTLVQELRHRMGFDGYVVTDFPAQWSTTDIKNGLNIEMPGMFMTSVTAVKMAMDRGDISMNDVNTRVHETLKTMFRFGMFDRKKVLKPVNVERGHKAALKVAESGAVLLKNQDSLLPLNEKKTRSIAIAGDVAKEFTRGGGSSNVIPTKEDNALEEITKRSKGAKVTFNKTRDTKGAAENARKADVALVFVNAETREGFDRRGIDLSDKDIALIDAVSKANANTAVIVQTGGPVTMPWLGKVKSVLNMWLPGQAGGEATARLLYGDVNPSGHLPQTFPAANGQWPANTNHQYPGDYRLNPHYTEGIFMGYRWYQKENVKPLFPFGYGLSYTSFKYSNPKLIRTSGDKASPIKLEVTVTNTGQRGGDTVVQVYVRKPGVGMEVPKKELAGFKKIYLRAGETMTIPIEVDPFQLSVWSDSLGKFIVQPGKYVLYVGQHVNSTPLSTTYTVR
ncbi:MAG: glycoside hydrolase family 3 C-terminal domain-containing protein [Lawsonella sp.]